MDAFWTLTKERWVFLHLCDVFLWSDFIADLPLPLTPIIQPFAVKLMISSGQDIDEGWMVSSRVYIQLAPWCSMLFVQQRNKMIKIINHGLFSLIYFSNSRSLHFCVLYRSMFSPDYRNWWISILSGWACSQRIRSYRCGYASCSEMSLSCVGTSGFPARQPTQRVPCPYIRYFIDSCIQRWL